MAAGGYFRQRGTVRFIQHLQKRKGQYICAKSKKCHGGGELVAVNRTYCSKHRLGLETNLEILWTQTRLTGVYFPTWSDVDTWSKLDKSLELLFILYINDLTNHVDSCEISLYADDSKLS